jgi:hypothetical protein
VSLLFLIINSESRQESRSQKLQTKKNNTEERLAASQNGIASADKVIQMLRRELPRKRNGNAVNRISNFFSEDDEEQRENGGLDWERDLSENGRVGTKIQTTIYVAVLLHYILMGEAALVTN